MSKLTFDSFLYIQVNETSTFPERPCTIRSSDSMLTEKPVKCLKSLHAQRCFTPLIIYAHNMSELAKHHKDEKEMSAVFLLSSLDILLRELLHLLAFFDQKIGVLGLVVELHDFIRCLPHCPPVLVHCYHTAFAQWSDVLFNVGLHLQSGHSYVNNVEGYAKKHSLDTPHTKFFQVCLP